MNHIRPLKPERARKRTVLCIEDEPEAISLIKLILERGGFRVIGALNGRDGLELAREANPDVVLLDLMMPGLDGWEVTRRMKADEALRGIPVIVLTGVDETSEGSRDLQADDYVTKPFAPRDLIRRVQEAVDPAPREAAPAPMVSSLGG
jgi:CheY-like chemotaxis protein